MVDGHLEILYIVSGIVFSLWSIHLVDDKIYTYMGYGWEQVKYKEWGWMKKYKLFFNTNYIKKQYNKVWN